LVAAVRQSDAAGYVNNTHAASDLMSPHKRIKAHSEGGDTPAANPLWPKPSLPVLPAFKPASGLTRSGPEVRPLRWNGFSRPDNP
jgi:hypothetical protein